MYSKEARRIGVSGDDVGCDDVGVDVASCDACDDSGNVTGVGTCAGAVVFTSAGMCMMGCGMGMAHIASSNGPHNMGMRKNAIDSTDVLNRTRSGGICFSCHVW